MVSVPGRVRKATASALLGTVLLGAGAPLREGERLALDDPRLAQWLPPEVHAARAALLGDGAQLEIGPTARPLPAALPYRVATGRFASQVRLRPDGMLENYVAGQPFPVDDVDCAGDPEAGTKLAWDAAFAWEADGADGRFRIEWEDGGEPVGEAVEGTFLKAWLAHRVEPRILDDQAGLLFPGEQRSFAIVTEVRAPPADRGIRAVRYRYRPEAREGSGLRNEQVWVFVPLLRRILRWSDRPPGLAMPATPLVPEQHPSYTPWPPAARWRCVSEGWTLAPLARPPGPTVLSPEEGWEDLRFEPRRVVVLEERPRAESAARRRLYLDRQTLRPFYAVAFPADGAGLRVTMHAWTWSADDPPRDAGWEGVPAVRALLPHRTLIARTATGTRTRIDSLDVEARPLAIGRLRRAIGAQMFHCVAAGTAIATPDGPRNIEDLRRGDAVWSWDEQRAVRVVARIASIEVGRAAETLRFAGSLRVTPEHPLFASDAWVPAGLVDARAELLRLDGDLVRAGVPERLADEVEVFDLEIDGPANFFAGGLLVHNKSR